MHSPHNPQPTVGLGDDPDPASELGARLAAASQTVQGLLTNYLFYGQRRSNDRAPSGVQRMAREAGHDQHREHARDSLAGGTRLAAKAEHYKELAGPGAGKDSLPKLRAVPEEPVTNQPRLQLVVVPEPSAKRTAGDSAEKSTQPSDPLARDALADDPLSRSHPLDLLSRDEPHGDHLPDENRRR